MDFVNFLIKNYLWIVIVFGILIISLIGYLADRYNKSRKQNKAMKEEKKNNEQVNIVDIDGNNVIDNKPLVEETPIVTEEMVSEPDNFNFPEVDSNNMSYDPTPISPTPIESNTDSFVMPDVDAVQNNFGNMSFSSEMEDKVETVPIQNEIVNNDIVEPEQSNISQEINEIVQSDNEVIKKEPVDIINEWEKTDFNNDMSIVSEENNKPELNNNNNDVVLEKDLELESNNNDFMVEENSELETNEEPSKDIDNTITDEDFWKL